MRKCIDRLCDIACSSLQGQVDPLLVKNVPYMHDKPNNTEVRRSVTVLVQPHYMVVGIVVMMNRERPAFDSTGDKSHWKWKAIQLPPRA